MITKIYDMSRSLRWRALRHKIRTVEDPERYRLLRILGDELRALAPSVVRASSGTWDINVTLELATSQGAVLGGWWNAWPANPGWPGRDRLFLGRREDLLSISCGLAVLGFFPVDRVAQVVDAAMEAGREAEIPGLEACGLPFEEMACLAWESAIESGRSKRRWREQLGAEAGANWAEAKWCAAPEVWRTCIVADSLAPGARILRDMPSQGAEQPAGLVAMVTVNRADSANTAEQWRVMGWEAAVVARSDCLGLYHTLNSAPPDKPLAVMVAVGPSPQSPASRTGQRSRDTKLLGEMSDEQFNAIINETIQF